MLTRLLTNNGLTRSAIKLSRSYCDQTNDNNSMRMFVKKSQLQKGSQAYELPIDPSKLEKLSEKADFIKLSTTTCASMHQYQNYNMCRCPQCCYEFCPCRPTYPGNPYGYPPEYCPCCRAAINRDVHWTRGRRRFYPPPCIRGNIPPNPCCPEYHYCVHRPHCRDYEYMRRRTKCFPWGDGVKSFFHKDGVNFLPGECPLPPLCCVPIMNPCEEEITLIMDCCVESSFYN